MPDKTELIKRNNTPEAFKIRERLELFYRGHLHMTCREFERNMGRSAGYVANFSGNPRKVTLTMFEKVYPMLNLDWVLTGNGSMIKPEYENRALEVHTIPKRKRVKYVADLTDAVINGDANIGSNPTMIKGSSGDVKKLVENLIEDNKQKQKMIDRLMAMLEKLTNACK